MGRIETLPQRAVEAMWQSHLQVFTSLKIKGGVTEKIEADFIEFSEKFHAIVAEMGRNYSLRRVYDSLSPGNFWENVYDKENPLELPSLRACEDKSSCSFNKKVH